MIVLVILVIVGIFILIIQNNNLHQEVIRLQRENEQLRKNQSVQKEEKKEQKIEEKVNNFCPECGSKLKDGTIRFCSSCGFDLINKIRKNNSTITEKKLETSNEIKPVPVIKTPRDEKEIKNNLILITGAVLIILSAILFLATTWDTSTSYLKTLILVLMFIVFFSTSKIAEKVFKLEDTARVFYYIAISYIPILLFSVSLFGLIGDYFSINGEGKYIFLATSSLVVSLIYYVSSTKKNSKFLNVGSYLFEVLTVIVTTLIFTNKFNIIIISLLVYNCFISYLLPKIINLYNENINKRVSLILYIALSIIIVGLSSLTLTKLDITSLVLFVIYILTSKLVIEKIYDKKSIYKGIYPVVIELITLNSIKLFTSNYQYIQIGVLIGLILLTIYQALKDNKVEESLFVEIFLVSPIIYTATLATDLKTEYFVLITLLITAIITYKFNENIKKFIGILIPIFMNILVVNLVVRMKLTTLTIPLISILIFIISLLLENKNKELSESFSIISTIFIFGSILINIPIHYEKNLILVIMSLTSLIYILVGLLKNNNIYKVLGYLLLNIVSLKIFYNIDVNNLYVIAIPIVTIILTIINSLIKETKVKDYLIVQYIISFISIYFYEITLSTIITNIILSIIFYFFVVEKDNKIKYASIISFIPMLYLIDNKILSDSNIMYIVSLCVITILSAIAYKKKDINDYSILSFIFIGFHIMKFYDDKYMNLILLIITSIIHTITTKENKKDLFKCGIYISSFMLVSLLIKDTGIEDKVVLRNITEAVTALLITRTVIKRHTTDYKVLEYILLALINIVSISQIESETTAMLLIGVFTIEVIISYIIKLGPLLVCSLIATLVTIFKLTEDFWLNLSWWIYVLAVGTILIVFAVNNEIKEKNGSSLKSKFQDIKNKFNL